MKNLALADWERLQVASFEREKKIEAQVAEKRSETHYNKKQKRSKTKRIRGAYCKPTSFREGRVSICKGLVNNAH